jgi:uncharacterized protein
MLDLLIVQLTPFCNINCSYCYLNDRSNPQKISTETINLLIDRLFESHMIPQQLTIIFHSGEPLVVGPQFLRSIIELFNCRLQGTTIRYAIQTNGTLISLEWCELFRKFDIHIGVSIDGPACLHDLHRKSRNGKGTHALTMAGITLLKKNLIPYHGIVVITKDSLNFSKEIFDFFHDNGFSQLGLNIEETEGVNTHSSVFANELSGRVAFFYEQIYGYYLESDRRMSLREFDRALSSIMRTPAVTNIRLSPLRTHQLEPFAIVTVDYKGNFSTYSPELIGQKSIQYGDFILGNVRDMGFKQASRSRLFRTLKKDIQTGVRNCKRQCAYFNVCGGGAPANKLYENKSFSSTETRYCQYNIKIPTDLVLSKLEEGLL